MRLHKKVSLIQAANITLGEAYMDENIILLSDGQALEMLAHPVQGKSSALV